MHRPRFERSKRMHSIRLTLEHLESRRLMAGLNVLVFNDLDVSRSYSSAVDQPASNRLVYVDLNRNLRFDDAEPLAVTGADGMARFADLLAGDYLIGLANRNDAQIQTTAFTNDATATAISTVGSSRGLLATADLKHAWSVSATGRLTPVGSEDANRLPMNLGGPAVSLVSPAADFSNGNTEASLTAKSGFAVVDLSPSQRAVVGLDFELGIASYLDVSGLPSDARITNLSRMQDGLAVAFTIADQTYVAAATATAQSLVLGPMVSVPSGRVVSGPARNQLVIINSANDASTVQLIQLPTSSSATAAAVLGSASFARNIEDVTIARDGGYLFVSYTGGGVDVLTASASLAAVAQLADASGPVTATSLDGRFVTASSSKANELVAWDSLTWLPTGRITLPGTSGPVSSIAVDTYGMRAVASTAQGLFNARLMNPTPQPVVVRADRTNQTNLGVRVLGNPVQLPTQVDLFETTDEDTPLELNLPGLAELKSLTSSHLIFATLSGPSMGTLEVSPSGQIVYRPLLNRSGEDSARIRVFDGLSSSIVMLSLEVRPVNDLPADMTVDVNAVPEFASAGDLVGFVTVFDSDSDAKYSISIDDTRFYAVDGQIYRSNIGQLDYETEPFVTLSVTATDSSDSKVSITRQVMVPIVDENEGPLGISASDLTAPENVVEGYTLGNLQIDDPDGHGFYVFSVSDSRFIVNNGQLQLMPGRPLDYEAESTIDLMVTAIDPLAKGPVNYVTSRLFVEVLDFNDPPTGIVLSDSSANSSQNGTIIGSITVIDQDIDDTHDLTVYDDRFRIVNHMLVINTTDPLGTAPIPVLVSARDPHGASVTQTVMVTLINDAPFQNPNNPLDVDGDGKVYPRDVLLLINTLNRKGSHTLMPQSGNGEDPNGAPYPDVNGDGLLTPLDALILINFLNQRQGAASSGEGEGEGEPFEMVATARQPAPVIASHFATAAPPITSLWTIDPQEKARRDAIDAELETILDQLSFEHLR